MPYVNLVPSYHEYVISQAAHRSNRRFQLALEEDTPDMLLTRLLEFPTFH